MDSVLVPCKNNTVLISLNSRNKKKRDKMTHKKASSIVMISPPSPKLAKLNNMSKTCTSLKPATSASVLPKRIQDSLEFTDYGKYSTDNLKELLVKIVKDELKSLKILEERCNIVGSMIKVVESSCCFSEKDAADLVKLLNQMAKTVNTTSEIEIELGIKTRLCEKKTIEIANLKNNYDSLYKRAVQSNSELKELKEKLKGFQEENSKLFKINENEKHRYSEVHSKIQTLEESLWVLTNSSSISPQDSVTKLKGAISALLKDAYDYKR